MRAVEKLEVSERLISRNTRSMSAARARVAVTSPQPVVIEGFTAMLARHEDRIEVVEWPKALEEEEPDVVLYDVLFLAEGEGTDLDVLVKKTACVVFAVGRDLRPDLLSVALSRGADGFFDLGVSDTELLTAVESAMTGWQVGDPGPDPLVGSATSSERAEHGGDSAGLSPRERRVLALIAQGLSNEDIAARDFLSVNSVKSYIRAAYRKIGVASRTQALVWAVHHGYTTDEDASTFRHPDDDQS
ncbi:MULTISPECIES: response regulator transcription factor [unclassified Nocardioides]|uniref:response regulator transcription factor n=1 Tax=unclassified Nocardioides TaxID=2615069 RepID=UPI00361E087F